VFETGIILALLLAMLKTVPPKQWAIIIVLVTALLIRTIEEFGLYWAESFVSLVPSLTIERQQWIVPDLIVLFQVSMAVYLVSCLAWVKDKESRIFFLLMAVFLMFSSLLIPLYKYDAIKTFSAYTFLYHASAILQVLTVFYYSNGIRQLIRNTGNLFSNFRRGAINQRG